ncbi:MAG: ATP-binding cassette domain-containing protein [Gammaproteobacteria bacterium]|nr:ATP-binding cassette domain-containing protein [Gammaproteobacteria bacterium]
MIKPTQHDKEVIIKVSDVTLRVNHQDILKDINVDIYKDEIFGIVGQSGCGKTTLLRSILMLDNVSKGSIRIFGKDITRITEKKAIDIQRRWGVMFQQNALFSSLTVLENVLFPLRTQTDLPLTLQKEIAYLKIALAGLPLDAGNKYPSELSGGMAKRAALARAIALDPELLLLDEPGSGLDPHSAQALDQLILDLRKALNLTIIVVTHDLDTLWRVTDRVAFLGEGQILATLPIDKLVKESHPSIKEYFSGQRAERTHESETSKPVKE